MSPGADVVTPRRREPVSTGAPTRARRPVAVRRSGARVTPRELFFDLVSVLALTRYTALMAARPT